MKENNFEELNIKLKNLTYIVVIGFIAVGLLIIGLYFSNGSTSKTTSNNDNGNGNTQTEYDVSKMTQVSGSDAAKLFDEKGTHFLYIGRSTCSVCVKLVPELNTVISDLDIKMNYLPLGSDFRTSFKDLFGHLSIETKVNDNEGTFGELLEEFGYTPMVIVIKDGKMVDGFVGQRSADVITTLFKKYL